MAIMLRRSDISFGRITMLLVVFAGIKNPPLIAQSTATVAVSATVLQDPQRATPAAIFELVDARGTSTLPAGALLLAAARGRAFSAPVSLSPGSALLAPAAPLQAPSSPGGSLPWRDAPPAEQARSGPPEHTPTVRLTVAYTTN
jgi:hypothetical protein